MKWTVLYFDDQIQNIEVYKELLEDEFELIGCNDALRYDSLLLEHNPHAIMLDVHMPELDGHELYKKIISHPRYNDCPIFFISGDISDENKVRSYKSGGIDFLSRDIRSDELILRLGSRIRLNQQTTPRLGLGNLLLDMESLELIIGHEIQNTTMLEMRILGVLLRTFPAILTRTAMIKKIWGEESVKPGTVNTHLTNLKPKIEKWDHQIKIKDDQILILKKD
jgi:DNA-binding response OmpR family regulator